MHLSAASWQRETWMAFFSDPDGAHLTIMSEQPTF